MTTPALIYLSIIGIGMIASAFLHGRGKTVRNDFGLDLMFTAVSIGLLHWGGFFDSPTTHPWTETRIRVEDPKTLDVHTFHSEGKWKMSTTEEWSPEEPFVTIRMERE